MRICVFALLFVAILPSGVAQAHVEMLKVGVGHLYACGIGAADAQAYCWGEAATYAGTWRSQFPQQVRTDAELVDVAVMPRYACGLHSRNRGRSVRLRLWRRPADRVERRGDAAL